MRSHCPQLEKSCAWGICVVRLIADHTPASSRRITSAHGFAFVVGPRDRRNQGIIHVVPEGLSRIVVSGEKPRVRDVKRDLVHELVLVCFNKGWPLCLGKVVRSSLSNRPSGIYASIVEGRARQLLEFRLWVCRHRLEILFIVFQLHSWELGTYVRVHRRVLIFV